MSFNVKQLKEMAKEKKVAGYSRMNKEDLERALGIGPIAPPVSSPSGTTAPTALAKATAPTGTTVVNSPSTPSGSTGTTVVNGPSVISVKSKVKELQEECKRRGLPYSGLRKDELLAHLGLISKEEVKVVIRKSVAEMKKEKAQSPPAQSTLKKVVEFTDIGTSFAITWLVPVEKLIPSDEAFIKKELSVPLEERELMPEEAGVDPQDRLSCLLSKLCCHEFASRELVGEVSYPENVQVVRSFLSCL